MSAYDEKLLAAAPSVTKAELQDGYNADLLREPTTKRRGTPTARALPPHQSSHSDPTSSTPLNPKGSTSQVVIGDKEHHLSHDIESTSITKKGNSKPFWRTKKGIIGLVVIGVVIILAAVLGGVFGSRSTRGGNLTPSGNQENGSPSEGANQGDGRPTGVGEQGGGSAAPSPTSGPNIPVSTGQVPNGGVSPPTTGNPNGASPSGDGFVPISGDNPTGQEGQISSSEQPTPGGIESRPPVEGSG